VHDAYRPALTRTNMHADRCHALIEDQGSFAAALRA